MTASERHDFIARNMGLVGFVVNRLRHHPGVRAMSDADAMGAGYVGLCLAVDNYDPERGRFSTYAYWTILRTILRHCGDYHSVYRLPSQLTTAERQAAAVRGVPLTLSDEDGHEYDWLPAPEVAPDAADPEYWDDDAADAMRAIEQLGERERDILRARLHGMTLGDLSRRWGLTRERIRQIEAKAIRDVKTLIAGGTVRPTRANRTTRSTAIVDALCGW